MRMIVCFISYGTWIYNYLCSQCLWPLMLWVRISIRVRCTTLCDKVCQLPETGRWFSPRPPVSSNNKTDRHAIAEILLKVHIMLYTSPWSRFELTTSMVIGTDCIGSCKSKYHTIWYFLFHLIIKNSIIKIAVNFRIFRIASLDFKGCSCTLSTIVFPYDNDATHI
jgi:hypothetical protein